MPTSEPTDQPVELKPINEAAPAAKTWINVAHTARTRGQIVALLAVLVFGGGAAGFIIASVKGKNAVTTNVTPTKVDNLSPEDLKKLAEAGTSLGESGQVLTIGANSVFKGKVDVASDLTLGGKFNANGPVTFGAVSSTGTSSFGAVAVNQNLQVNGQTTLSRGLSVQELLSVRGNANVSGGLSARTVTADTVSTKQLQLSGPFVFGHIATQGPTPGISGGSIGGGGTVNISGNDTAGTININPGNGGASGLLASVTFRAQYAPSVRVIISPTSPAAAQVDAYVTRGPSGFQVRAAGSTSGLMSFDYIVVQ